MNNNIIDVKITDGFWKGYLQTVVDQVIPYQWEALNDRIQDIEPSHAIKNFQIAAGEADGEFYGMVFQDSDVAKWLETVAFSLENVPNPELEQVADEVIDLLGRAQDENGYLNTYYMVKEPNNRWTNVRDNHELYCAGHFIEAAVAYYQVTGKKKFIEIVSKLADHIVQTFGPEECQIKGYPGHQEIELALVKLYDVTGQEEYLKMSKFFIDERGKQPNYFDIEKEARNDEAPFWFNDDHAYHQAHEPVREQEVAVGHSVRAVYMYTAMADIALKTNDQTLIKATKKLWDNVTKKQMYVTGGIGSMAFGEAFSFDYDLPNDLSYTETCASIALVFWAKRMLHLEMDGKYADIMELALYNGTISGMDLDGKKFFYVNPLEVLPRAVETRHEKQHVKPVRQPWFACACCPPNLARLIASIGHYVYSQQDDQIFVHLYLGNESTFEIEGKSVKLTQRTNYPWDGDVNIQVSPVSESQFTLAFRVPGWAKEMCVKINGELTNYVGLVKNGYVYIDRIWQPNDTVELSFPMVIERIKAHPKVRDNVGKVALKRGPIVYCLEEVDNGSNLNSIFLPKTSQLTSSFDEELLNGVVTISGEIERVSEQHWNDILYQSIEEEMTTMTFKAIPYYAWCNRVPGEMLVWINES